MGEEERRGSAFSLGKFMFSECERGERCGGGRKERFGFFFRKVHVL